MRRENAVGMDSPQRNVLNWNGKLVSRSFVEFIFSHRKVVMHQGRMCFSMFGDYKVNVPSSLITLNARPVWVIV